MHSMLIVSRKSPWSGPSAREALDIALAGGAFDLPIAMLFLDDGVLQLAPNQKPVSIQQKDVTANLQALEMFGIDELYACKSSLACRGISPDPRLAVEVLDDDCLGQLINRFDHVITL